MIIEVVAGIIAVFVFLFVFWRQLKDDYVSNQIFTTGFSMLGIVGLLGYLSFIFSVRAWFWICMLAILIVVFYNVRRFRMRLVEVAEASIIGWVWIWLFVYGAVFMLSYDFKYLIGVGVTLLFVFLFYFFNSSYKKFGWYKSGRVGFAGFATLASAFLVRTLVAIWFTDMVSFVGSIDIYLSSITTVSSFGVLVYLSRKV